MIPYVRNHYPVGTQSLSRTYAIIIPYVRNHDFVRTQSLSRTYAIIIPYVYAMIKYGRATLRFPHHPPPPQTNPLTPADEIVTDYPSVQVTPLGNLKLVSSYPL